MTTRPRGPHPDDQVASPPDTPDAACPTGAPRVRATSHLAGTETGQRCGRHVLPAHRGRHAERCPRADPRGPSHAHQRRGVPHFRDHASPDRSRAAGRRRSARPSRSRAPSQRRVRVAPAAEPRRTAVAPVGKGPRLYAGARPRRRGPRRRRVDVLQGSHARRAARRA